MNGLGGLPTGCLRILNVGAGDLKLSFDNADPVEIERAKRTVEDMLQRGYTLLVDVPGNGGRGGLTRVKRFDPKRCEYIVATDALYAGDRDGKTEAPPKAARRKASKEMRIPAAGVKAVAIGRSAGG